jgi:hypothetical protein
VVVVCLRRVVGGDVRCRVVGGATARRVALGREAVTPAPGVSPASAARRVVAGRSLVVVGRVVVEVVAGKAVVVTVGSNGSLNASTDETTRSVEAGGVEVGWKIALHQRISTTALAK